MPFKQEPKVRSICFPGRNGEKKSQYPSEIALVLPALPSKTLFSGKVTSNMGDRTRYLFKSTNSIPSRDASISVISSISDLALRKRSDSVFSSGSSAKEQP